MASKYPTLSATSQDQDDSSSHTKEAVNMKENEDQAANSNSSKSIDFTKISKDYPVCKSKVQGHDFFSPIPAGSISCFPHNNNEGKGDNNNEENNSDSRSFLCTLCKAKFSTAQALGGQQNAHKTERALEKKRRQRYDQSALGLGQPHFNPYFSSEKLHFFSSSSPFFSKCPSCIFSLPLLHFSQKNSEPFAFPSTMEKLKHDEIILIAQKVAAYGTRHLLSFMQISKYHEEVAKTDVVLRALRPDHLNLFAYADITPEQQNFLNMVINSGHADYCVLRGVHMMLQDDPDVSEIRRILDIASAAGVESANYFLMMLDASEESGFEVERAISTFTRFFRSQKLQQLRLCLSGRNTPYFFRSFWWDREMPKSLVLRTLCTSKDTCKGDGRLPGFHWPPPGNDHEYSQTNVCILCRFDIELRGFIRMFSFGPIFYGL